MSRLPQFRELLSQVEYEYILLLGDPGAHGANVANNAHTSVRLQRPEAHDDSTVDPKFATQVDLDEVQVMLQNADVNSAASRDNILPSNGSQKGSLPSNPTSEAKSRLGDRHQPFEPLQFEDPIEIEIAYASEGRCSEGDDSRFEIAASSLVLADSGRDLLRSFDRSVSQDKADRALSFMPCGSRGTGGSNASEQALSKSGSFEFAPKGTIGSANSHTKQQLRGLGDGLPELQTAAVRPSFDPRASMHSVTIGHYDSCLTDRSVALFPVWWNPVGQELKQLVAWRSRVSEENEDDFDEHTDDGDNHSLYVFSPVSRLRLLWEAVGYILILYVAWAMPFQIVFGSENLTPSWMIVLDVVITTFFLVDVLLSFNTGFVDNDRVILDRRAVVRRYILGWFCFDLLTCFPFNMVDPVGEFTTRGRLWQILSGLKPIRFIRLVHRVRSLQTTENAYFSTVTNWRWLFQNVAVVVILLWNVHVLSCMWSAMQPDAWRVNSFSETLQEYFDVFVAVFIAMSNGHRMTSQTVGMQVLEVLIATEHVWIMICLSVYAIFKFKISYADAAKFHFDRDNFLRYLKSRGMSLPMKVEVLGIFNECERLKALERDFAILSKGDLPAGLQQKINVELWQRKLMTIGITEMIMLWDDRFCRHLALFCQEEVIAKNAILFHVADSASTAYHVLIGEFSVFSPLIDDDLPNFEVDMWLGEEALVNSTFRRGLRAVAVCLSSVMAVPSSSFQHVLADLNLSEEYELWAKEALWRGICGRCGKIEDHFQDRCPILRGKDSRRSKELFQGDANENVGAVELLKYLRLHQIPHFRPHLEEVNVFTLQDLHSLDMSAFRKHLSRQDPPVELTSRDESLLAPKAVSRFQEKIIRGVSTHNEGQHFIFLSHYKVEAGTEAALMLSELEHIISQDRFHVANELAAPVFLDSEDLMNLEDLKRHVRDSMNLVLLLTNGVLSRPWCLVELVTAIEHDIPISLVQVNKLGTEFQFPTETFYADLLAGKTLNDEAKQLLDSSDIEIEMVESTLREVFKNIALPYSPHRAMQIRNAELQQLLDGCVSNNAFMSTASLVPWHVGQDVERKRSVRTSGSSQISPRRMTTSKTYSTRGDSVSRKMSTRSSSGSSRTRKSIRRFKSDGGRGSSY